MSLPLPDRSLCGNGAPPASRGAKIGRSALIRATRLATRRLVEVVPALVWAAQDGRLPYFPAGRVRVGVLVRRDPLWSARRLDDDNFWRGCKPILDGLADACIVANDRQFRLGSVTWEKGEPMHGELLVTLTAEEE